ncbi:MAG TPA: hypothetical protein VF791_18025 [Pyrinomonadaceae bacterium]
MIGNVICQDKVDSGFLPGEGQELSHQNREFLWRLFVEIGKCWKNVKWDSSNLKSSWIDLIKAKTEFAPSYTGEYINATYVVQELIDMYGEKDAFHKLFLDNGIPSGPPTTRLAHAKKYVIDEFIKMQVLASGFKHFGGPNSNYHGYVKGSRYTLMPEVREFIESIEESK